jgi:hypothetical protein
MPLMFKFFIFLAKKSEKTSSHKLINQENYLCRNFSLIKGGKIILRIRYSNERPKLYCRNNMYQSIYIGFD